MEKKINSNTERRDLVFKSCVSSFFNIVRLLLDLEKRTPYTFESSIWPIPLETLTVMVDQMLKLRSSPAVTHDELLVALHSCNVLLKELNADMYINVPDEGNDCTFTIQNDALELLESNEGLMIEG